MTSQGWEGRGVEVLTDQDFRGRHLDRPGTYAVCFAATWCPPTQAFVPLFLARKSQVPCTFALADLTDMDTPLWEDFQIEITPTLLLFRSGEPVGRWDGRPMEGLSARDLDLLAKTVRGLRPAAPS
jgi:thioredoxin-like negative regulator of GroEL